MRVYVDGAEVPVDRPSVAAALDAGRRAAESRRRVVVEAALDGVALDDEALESPSDAERPGTEVRFITADAAALVSVSLLEVADALDQASAEQTAAADLIQSGNLAGALPHLSQALMVWDTVQRVVLTGTQLLGISLEGLRVRPTGADGRAEDTIDVAVAVGALAERLTEIKRALSAQDWAGLSDALAYDMQEQAAVWRGVLAALADSVKKPVA